MTDNTSSTPDSSSSVHSSSRSQDASRPLPLEELSGDSMDTLLSQEIPSEDTQQKNQEPPHEKAPEMLASLGDLKALYHVPVQVSVVLGCVTMPVSQLLKLGRGAIIELDRRRGEPVEIYVNNRLVAKGEVVVMQDQLGVTLTDIVKTDSLISSHQ